MRTRSLLLVLGVFAVACVATAQPPNMPPTPPVPMPMPGPGSPPLPDAPPLVPPLVYTPPTPTSPKAVEEIIRELEEVQVAKAQLAKREADLRALLRERLDGIQKQVDKLGAGPAAGPRGPDRVGRILIEGAASTKAAATAQDVMEKSGFAPGAVLQYPALEKAKKSLEKAGFPGAEVLAVESSQSASSRDVVVRLPAGTPKK